MFLSLFAERDDDFAKRWESFKMGTAGYVPVCNNEWTYLCPKSNGSKMKCRECDSQKFLCYDISAVEMHLKGEITAGVYPMFSDETCRFLVLDFDGNDYDFHELQRDVLAIKETCVQKGISVSIELSLQS